MSKSQHAILRENLRNACESYWAGITTSGWAAENLASRKEGLCRYALRLYIFEQGMDAAKRGTKK